MTNSAPPSTKSPEPDKSGAGNPNMAPATQAPATQAPGKPLAREAVPPGPPSSSRALPVLYFLGFAALAGAVAWIWQNPPLPPEPPVGALQARLDALETRPAEIRSTPAPAFDPAPLLARIAALEARTQTTLTPAPPSQAPPDLGLIKARIAALEARPAINPADAALGERIGRIARIQAIAAALETGRKLGNVPDAPPALQRFANVNPPTEAGLRLAFPAEAQAALVASRPIDPGWPWLTRIWGRLQSLITIREGEHVLVGDPAAGVVAAAQRALDAGDIAGAVTALGRLNPQAAQAMSGWTDQAKALLEARAALAVMAAGG